MARPRKNGLDYFPFDVDIFENDKFFDLQNEYGPLGEVIYIRLLCLVYKNGYYYRFDSMDKLASMMIRSIGNRWTRDKKIVIEVISYLAKCNLFSSELMQRNILTSRGIQRRYLSAVGRRQSNIDEFNLLEKKSDQEGLIPVPEIQISDVETQVIATETQVSVYDNSTKENKRKENKTKINNGSIVSDFEECWQLYPKKEGKKKAFAAYERAVKKNITTKEKVIEGIKNYVAHIKQNNIEYRFVKQGGTYFSDECWNDEFTVSAKEKDYSFDLDEYKALANNFGDDDI